MSTEPGPDFIDCPHCGELLDKCPVCRSPYYCETCNSCFSLSAYKSPDYWIPEAAVGPTIEALQQRSKQ